MKSQEEHITADSDYYVYTASNLAKKLFFYPLCTGEFTYEPGYYLKRNHFDSFLILMITKGQCTVTQNEISMSAGKGDVLLLDCYAPHHYETDTGYQAVWLHFDGPLSRNYYEQIIEQSGNQVSVGTSHPIAHKLQSIFLLFKTSSPIQEAAVSHLINGMLTELLLTDIKKDSPSETQSAIARTIAYMNEHFSSQLSLEELAAHAALSPFYFTRLFSKETGFTPHQYMIATRLNAAKFLLKTTDLSIKEIGMRTGFLSESSFCITFKKWETVTAGEFRGSDR